MLAALLLAACGGRQAGETPGIDWSTAQDMTLILVDDRFIPAELDFAHGQVYRLRLENRGAELHEFTAPAFLAAITLRERTALAAAGNEIVIQPRTAKTITFMAGPPGRYDLICADHDWAGMLGTIVVE
jgi:plastocyanin